MKYINQIFLICFLAFFTACSSKQNLNLDEINSISLNNNIIMVVWFQVMWELELTLFLLQNFQTMKI